MRRIFRILWWLIRWGFRFGVILVLVVLGLRWINPPITYLMLDERARLGAITKVWVDIEDISPHMQRSAVAAEDANYCAHWGFDFEAIQLVLDTGATRGASTISQQVAKNVFLWPQRSWVRKGLEAGFTLMIEGLWGKRRILEVYLNVAEFDEGVFGVEAAAQRYFSTGADSLSLRQASRIAMVLPNPRKRNAARPSSAMAKRARSIASGAETIAQDGRADCFSGSEAVGSG